jgi:hypothetical protein
LRIILEIAGIIENMAGKTPVFCKKCNVGQNIGVFFS